MDIIMGIVTIIFAIALMPVVMFLGMMTMGVVIWIISLICVLICNILERVRKEMMRRKRINKNK